MLSRAAIQLVSAPGTDTVLAWLVIAILALLGLAFVAAMAVFVLRLLHNLRQRRQRELGDGLGVQNR